MCVGCRGAGRHSAEFDPIDGNNNLWRIIISIRHYVRDTGSRSCFLLYSSLLLFNNGTLCFLTSRIMHCMHAV